MTLSGEKWKVGIVQTNCVPSSFVIYQFHPYSNRLVFYLYTLVWRLLNLFMLMILLLQYNVVGDFQKQKIMDVLEILKDNSRLKAMEAEA